MTKSDLWPKDGKLKKGLIIVAVVITSALLITLLEEKTNIKAGKKLPLVIAFACIAIWVYTPANKEDNAALK